MIVTGYDRANRPHFDNYQILYFRKNTHVSLCTGNRRIAFFEHLMFDSPHSMMNNMSNRLHRIPVRTSFDHIRSLDCNSAHTKWM